MKTKITALTLALSLSTSVFSASVDQILGSHKGEEMTTSEACIVTIKRVEGKKISFSFSANGQSASYEMKESLVAQQIAAKRIYVAKQQNISMSQSASTFLDIVISDSANKFAYANFSQYKSQRWCTYNCTSENKQFVCGF